MSYVSNNLLSGENVQYQANVSLWSFWRNAVLAIVLFTVLVSADAFIALLAAAVPLAFAAVSYLSTELAITNKRVIAKFGFISRDTIEMNLDKVESIQVNQSIIGRILNFGSIVVSGAGNPQTPIVGISKPLDFRRRFLELQDESKNAPAATETKAAA